MLPIDCLMAFRRMLFDAGISVAGIVTSINGDHLSLRIDFNMIAAVDDVYFLAGVPYTVYKILLDD